VFSPVSSLLFYFFVPSADLMIPVVSDRSLLLSCSHRPRSVAVRRCWSDECLVKKQVVFWDVALCRSWVNRRFGRMYCLRLQGRNIRERGTSVSTWPDLQGYEDQYTLAISSPVALDFSPPLADTLSLIYIPLLPACWPSPGPYPSPLCWFPIWSTLPPSLFLCSWLFPTGDSVCSHPLTLVPCSRIFLPSRGDTFIRNVG
jgi:hypothetical protein